MAGGNASMADWDPNEAPRTRVILADSHVLPEPRCMRAASSQIVILSTSPARPATRPAGSREPWRPLNDRRHQSARSRNSRQSLNTAPLRHEHFELAPLRLRVPLVEGHHLRVVLADGGDLIQILDDLAVPCDDQPSSGGHHGYPVRIEHG